MAMGIDATTVGARRPKGCEVRKHTNDFVEGLNLSEPITYVKRILVLSDSYRQLYPQPG